jgi:hypothetical protein
LGLELRKLQENTNALQKVLLRNPNVVIGLLVLFLFSLENYDLLVERLVGSFASLHAFAGHCHYFL